MTSIQITSEDRYKRQESVAKVLNTLRFITPDEEYIFERASSSYSSELSDPFSDDEEPKIVSDQKKKRLSKLEADILLMSSFSPEFLKTQEVVKNEMMLGSNMCTEDILNIKPKFVKHEEDEQFLKEANEILDSCGLDVYLNSKEYLERKEKQELKESRNILTKKPKEVIIETNSLSGIWRMLESASVENGFPISCIGYNIYEDKRLEWIKRKDFPWDDKEKARVKCEDWLKKNNE